MNKISALSESWESSLLSALSVWGHSEKLVTCDPKESSHHSLTQLVPWSQISSLHSCEKSLSVGGKATSMPFARVVWTKTDPAVPILCTQWSHRGEVMMAYVTLGKTWRWTQRCEWNEDLPGGAGTWAVERQGSEETMAHKDHEEGAGRWEHPLSAPDMCLKANQKSSLSHERKRGYVRH